MRFVDIDLAELPAGWQDRAASALAELQREVSEAENVARAAGEDPAAARVAAISAGLKKPPRRRIWQDIKPALERLAKGKCWYSESKNPMSDKDVDHFRPKNRIAGDEDHEGYWWLAFTLRNFRFSSQWCNQRRVDVVHHTSGGKRDLFPLLPNSFRARRETDDIAREEPELLDPIDPDDWKLLTFRPDGHAIPAKGEDTVEYRRAEASINTYHLDAKPLVDGRRAVAGTIQRLVQELERLRNHIVRDPDIKQVYKSREIELLRAINDDAEYSASARAFARAEVYPLSHGHQARRGWLEEILN
jgi:uncharacterized protein (TIGR02646 family)